MAETLEKELAAADLTLEAINSTDSATRATARTAFKLAFGTRKVVFYSKKDKNTAAPTLYKGVKYYKILHDKLTAIGMVDSTSSNDFEFVDFAASGKYWNQPKSAYQTAALEEVIAQSGGQNLGEGERSVASKITGEEPALLTMADLETPTETPAPTETPKVEKKGKKGETPAPTETPKVEGEKPAKTID